MRPIWKGLVLAISLALLAGMLGVHTFAAADRRTALAQLEKLESQRAAEEFNFQMGVGLSDELKEGYSSLAASTAGLPEVADWVTYRLAEWDYSRDQFQEAIAALTNLASITKNKTISVEAQLLAAEILDSPYNPRRDSAAAERLLSRIEAENQGNARAAIAALGRRSTQLLEQRQSNRVEQTVTRKPTSYTFVAPNQSAAPHERVANQKYNQDLAKAYRNQAVAQGAQRDYAGAYKTLTGMLKAYNGENPYDYFTYTSIIEDLEFQKAVALAAQGANQEAIAELKAFIAKHPESHLSQRALARLDALDPQPVLEPQASTGGLANTGVLAPNSSCVCGPVALRAALAALRIDAPLASLITAAGTTSNGTTLEGLLAAAWSQGRQAYGLRVAKGDLAKLPTPSVALWYDHYVTVLSTSEDEVSLYDPIAGSITRTPTEFNALWEGVLLVFADTEAEAIQRLVGAEVLPGPELASIRGRFL